MKRAHAFLERGFSFPERLSLDSLSESVRTHLKALRLSEGEEFVMLNGQGSLGTYKVLESKKNVFSTERSELKQGVSLSPVIHVYLAPPKNDSLEETVRQLTEIGASSIRFLSTQNVQLKKNEKLSTERLQRISDGACEQCLRPHTLEIHSGFFSIEEALAQKNHIVFCDESLAEQNLIGFSHHVPKITKDSSFTLLIGPEGGWTDTERAQIKSKVFSLGLGEHILRVPTASVSAAFFLRLLYQQQQ